jgi:signal transduction histidine kinase
LPASLIVKESVAPVKLLAEQKNVQIEIDPVSEFETVYADRNRIAQVLQNLLSNAVTFSPSHSKIHLTCKTEFDFTEFRVSDEGPGIPRNEASSIFDRYKQVDGKVKSSGFGLGLAICKAIVEQNGGKIGVITEEGKGSTFWFKVPAGRQQLEKST